MAKIILHPEGESPEAIAKRRLIENAMRTPQERWERTFGMMTLAALFRRKGLIKELQSMGVFFTKSGKSCAECKTKMTFE
jgi:hypothetical protein